jgi:hypothetical protein
MCMQTNQAIEPSGSRRSWSPCQHQGDDSREEGCRYLHTLERLRGWAARAEHLHLHDEDERLMMGELWLLMAEASTAFDLCATPRDDCTRIPSP